MRPAPDFFIGLAIALPLATLAWVAIWLTAGALLDLPQMPWSTVR